MPAACPAVIRFVPYFSCSSFLYWQDEPNMQDEHPKPHVPFFALDFFTIYHIAPATAPTSIAAAAIVPLFAINHSITHFPAIFVPYILYHTYRTMLTVFFPALTDRRSISRHRPCPSPCRWSRLLPGLPGCHKASAACLSAPDCRL